MELTASKSPLVAASGAFFLPNLITIQETAKTCRLGCGFIFPLTLPKLVFLTLQNIGSGSQIPFGQRQKPAVAFFGMRSYQVDQRGTISAMCHGHHSRSLNQFPARLIARHCAPFTVYPHETILPEY